MRSLLFLFSTYYQKKLTEKCFVSLPCSASFSPSSAPSRPNPPGGGLRGNREVLLLLLLLRGKAEQVRVEATSDRIPRLSSQQLFTQFFSLGKGNKKTLYLRSPRSPPSSPLPSSLLSLSLSPCLKNKTHTRYSRLCRCGRRNRRRRRRRRCRWRRKEGLERRGGRRGWPKDAPALLHDPRLDYHAPAGSGAVHFIVGGERWEKGLSRASVAFSLTFPKIKNLKPRNPERVPPLRLLLLHPGHRQPLHLRSAELRAPEAADAAGAAREAAGAAREAAGAAREAAAAGLLSRRGDGEAHGERSRADADGHLKEERREEK